MMLNAEIDRANAKQGTPEWDAFVRKLHLDACSTFENYLTIPLGAFGFLDTLSTPITGTWTAIKALLSDLWEAALNCHPETLASLKGKSGRIGKSSKETTQGQRSGSEHDRKSKYVPLEKYVPLDLIGLHRFDLRNSMGRVFRRQGRFKFTRLSGIREAYSQAFSGKSGSIDSALGNSSLDCLSVVRNLIVHKSGVADAEYIKRSLSLNIPKAEIGKPILPDGKIVATLSRQAILSTKSLPIAADNWIAQN